jgi:hypothetical protein
MSNGFNRSFLRYATNLRFRNALAGAVALICAAFCSLETIVRADETVRVSTNTPDSAEDEHLQINPVYHALLSSSPGQHRMLGPNVLEPPLMIDGDSSASQIEKLKELLAEKYTADAFLQGSPSSPYLLTIDRRESSSNTGKFMETRMHLYFAAQGDLQLASDPQFLDSIFQLRSDSEGSANSLSLEQLQRIGFGPQDNPSPQEAIRLVDGRLFDRIRISGLVRSYWSKTGRSIVSAIAFDQRFVETPDLAALWERFERQEDGSLKAVEQGKLEGLGLYVKITPLDMPEGLLLVEVHGLLLEPYSWFQGANLIGSKLPPAVRNQVQAIRRSTIKAMRSHATRE